MDGMERMGGVTTDGADIVDERQGWVAWVLGLVKFTAEARRSRSDAEKGAWDVRG